MVSYTVKTTNILLDNDWVAKISDFGLCKIGITNQSRTQVSTRPTGTFGYMDPEYLLTHRPTKKSDVFAFGVVLLEVLCGRPAVDRSLTEDRHSLALWAKHCIEEGKIDELIDPSLRDQISSPCLKVFTEVAYKCLHNRPNGRPTMSDVVVSLEGALISQMQDRENMLTNKKSSKGKLSKAFQWSLGLLTKRKKDHDSSSRQSCPGSESTIDLRLLWLSADLPSRRFSIAEIQAATNNFNNELKLGEGGFSTTYKGWIDPGTLEVVIKCMNSSSLDAHSQVRAEMKAHSQLHDRHIISLIGYCADRDKLMLVYSYMVNRSLNDQLYGQGSGHSPLPWTKRLEICIGAAKGLQYLHYGSTQRIIHRNIKPSNILLDENWVAKISGFELSKVAVRDHMYVTTRMCDTLEYLDLEYIHQGLLTEKTDVYAFGVVLLEVVSARKPYDYSLDEEQMPLVHWFRTCLWQNKIDQLIDPYLIGRISPECLMQYLKVAWNCLHDWGTARLTMNTVVENLQIAMQLQQTWYNDDEIDTSSEDWIPLVNGRAYNNVLAYQYRGDFEHLDAS